ncbi:GIY-YIG nuclease family protein [Salmonella enterica]|nr:GIY-YIG nuclease family protein [Salmonella enterica]
MFHYTYKITNKINNKIYIGAHSTENLDDGYMGSGKLLKRAQDKYGIENFSKEILEFFDDKTSMFESEKNIVTEEFLKRPDVYNLKLGGEGGWDHLNTKEYLDKKKEASLKGAAAFKTRFENDLDLKEKYRKMGSERFKQLWDNPKYREKFLNTKSFLGKTHTPETINKMKESHARNKHQKGEKNSQFGMMWIHSLDEKVSKRIKKTDPIPEGWFKGRKMKF